jgi:hypothetical protein
MWLPPRIVAGRSALGKDPVYSTKQRIPCDWIAATAFGDYPEFCIEFPNHAE